MRSIHGTPRQTRGFLLIQKEHCPNSALSVYNIYPEIRYVSCFVYLMVIVLSSPHDCVMSDSATPLIVVVWPLYAAAYTGVRPVFPSPNVNVVLLTVHVVSYGYAAAFERFPATSAATGTSFPEPHVALSYLAHRFLSAAVHTSLLSLMFAVPQRTITACLSPVIVDFSMFRVPGMLKRIAASSFDE